MKLITELSESVEYLIEGAGENKKYFIEGIFAQAEKPNRNGRVYPLHIMESAVNKFRPSIDAKRAMGELNHPAGPTINLDRVSHLIEKLDFKGHDVYGRAKILDTPMGKIAKNLIDEGVQLGVSTRGLGSLKMINGINQVQEDFRMNTIDIVADPSAHDAFVNGIMEGIEWNLTVDGRLEEQTVEFIKAKKLTEERKVAAFYMFLEGLRTK